MQGQERNVPVTETATATASLFRSAVSTLTAKSLAIIGARGVAQEFHRNEPPARGGTELHGRLFLPRAPLRVPQRRFVPACARSGRLHLPVRRPDPVLDEGRGRAGAALLLLHHVGQR